MNKMKNNKYKIHLTDKLEQEGEYWCVNRYSEVWGKCTIFKSKNKEIAKILIK